MFLLMLIIFIIGYTLIVFEHKIKINKAASALLLGVLTWTVYILGGKEILAQGFSRNWTEFANGLTNPLTTETIKEFIVNHQLPEHISEISGIIFFLLGAMTIVEVIDNYQGFRILTDKIKTTNKVKLLWLLSFIAFFLSAILDNLTTTIVMIALIRKLITNSQHDRWIFASLIVIAANAGVHGHQLVMLQLLCCGLVVR